MSDVINTLAGRKHERTHAPHQNLGRVFDFKLAFDRVAESLRRLAAAEVVLATAGRFEKTEESAAARNEASWTQWACLVRVCLFRVGLCANSGVKRPSKQRGVSCAIDSERLKINESP